MAESISTFFADLDASGHSQNVLALTFSEFGRTIFENGSQGTDHGTGAPMFMFGNGVGSEILGDPQNLTDLDPYGDPGFSVDFRSVYATIMKNWLCAPEEVTDHILGEELQIMDNLLEESNPPIGSNDAAIILGHEPADEPGTAFDIKYSIKRRGNIRISLLNSSGQTIRIVYNAFAEAGSHTFTFRPNQFFVPPGEYFYRLEAGGRAYTRRIGLVNYERYFS